MLGLFESPEVSVTMSASATCRTLSVLRPLVPLCTSVSSPAINRVDADELAGTTQLASTAASRARRRRAGVSVGMGCSFVVGAG